MQCEHIDREKTQRALGAPQHKRTRRCQAPGARVVATRPGYYPLEQQRCLCELHANELVVNNRGWYIPDTQDASICIVQDDDGTFRVATQEDVNTLDVGEDLTDDEIETLDE